MPDFTLETAPICKTVRAFGMKVAGHDVSYGPTPYGRYQYGWDCDCAEFAKDRYGCEHTREAAKHRCGWNSHCEPYTMPKDRKCPDCGGELDFVRVAV